MDSYQKNPNERPAVYSSDGPTQGGLPPPVIVQFPPKARSRISKVPENLSFEDQSKRKGFVRKVYGTLMCQLLITGGIISLFVFVESIQCTNYIYNIQLTWIAPLVMFVTMISMAYCKDVRRNMPMNFVCLTLFTFAESFLLGVFAARFAFDEVLMAVGTTAAVSLALILFALQTKFDFTDCSGVLTMAVVIFSICGIVIDYAKHFKLIYGSLGYFFFCFYMIYDTELMMGQHLYSISSEEYIFAALNLYVDIALIFMNFLNCLCNIVVLPNNHGRSRAFLYVKADASSYTACYDAPDIVSWDAVSWGGSDAGEYGGSGGGSCGGSGGGSCGGGDD